MPNQKWTPLQEKFLKDNYQTMDDDELSVAIKKMGLHVSGVAVKRKRNALKLKRPKGRPMGASDSYQRVRTKKVKPE